MLSTSIYGDFTPTYLYIKQHSVTGLLYFGKTIKNPHKYLGSGTYWLNHINKHGKEFVVTLWSELFYEQEKIVQFAMSFSKELDIVKSKSWANLTEEYGIDGSFVKSAETKTKLSFAAINQHKRQPHPKGMLGKTHTESARTKMSEARVNRIVSEETKRKISESNMGHSVSQETRMKLAEANRGKIMSEETKRKIRETMLKRMEEKRASI